MTAWEAPPTATDIVRRFARERGNEAALIFQGETTTYGELDRRSSQIANALMEEGAAPRTRIGFLSLNCPAYFEVLFGVLKAGSVLVPLNYRLAPNELKIVMADAVLEILFVHAQFLPLIEPALESLPHLHTIVVLGDDGGERPTYEHWREASPAVDPMLNATADDEALQIYSSGTTGVPKGVVLTHGNVLAGIASALAENHAQYGPGGRLLVCNPLFHVAGTIMSFYALGQGATICLLDRADPALILETIETERAGYALLVPTVLRMIVQTPGIETRDMTSIRHILYGASPMTEDLLAAARQLFGSGVQFSQAYGMTESTGNGTVLRPEDHDPARGKLRSVGRAAAGSEVRIVDPDGAVVPSRTVGEIEIKSGTVTKGYWRKPEANKETLHDGWLRTGDAGYMDEEGYVYLHDRMKNMIISGGENIYPAEVENALSGHPAIADVAIVGIPSERWGEEPRAFVVLRPGTELSLEDLMAFVRQKLAGYKVPKSMEIVDALPKNPAGKTLHRELRKPFWEGKGRSI